MARAVGLVLDLAQAGFVAAVDAQDSVLARRWRPPVTRHDDVGDWVENCLREAGGTFSDLEWMCVGVGPGSFTGIRIALAFAQGAAWPRDLPLYGFTSFAALLLAHAGESGAQSVAVVPANAGRFYAASGLQDPGAVVDAEGLMRKGGPDTVLVALQATETLRAVAAAFGGTRFVGDRWDVSRVVRHARASMPGPLRPYYLLPSAAEAKAAAQKNAAPEFSIRPLRPADISRVAALERLCNPLPWSENALAAYAGTSDSSAVRRGWVVEMVGSCQVAGYLCVGMVDEEAEILIAGVEPALRRRGLGRMLLGVLGETLRAAGFRTVHLEVRRSNAPALAWYRSAGFKEHGIRRGYYADTGEDALLLRWDLPPRA